MSRGHYYLYGTDILGTDPASVALLNEWRQPVPVTKSGSELVAERKKNLVMGVVVLVCSLGLVGLMLYGGTKLVRTAWKR